MRKKLVFALLAMSVCIPICAFAEYESFEGDWYSYVPAWTYYNNNKAILGDEYNTSIEEYCARFLVEITDDRMIADGLTLDTESISVNEPYSIFLGEIKTEFFQKVFDSIYDNGDESNRIIGAKVWRHSNDILQYELLVEQEDEHAYWYKWCFFRYPGDNGEGIKGKWLISRPGALYSLSDNGTGMSKGYFDYEMTYDYNPEQNILTFAYSPEEEFQTTVIYPNCLLYEYREKGYTFSNYIMRIPQ